MNKFVREIVEELLILLEESDASKQAKKMGLEYIGFGRWIDKSGAVVAKTEDGKLVPVRGGKKKETPKLKTSTEKSKEKEESPKEKSKIKTIVGIYPGRFQPFGRHHYQTYQQLRTVTGQNTYIATSNVTDAEKSPFTFVEKKKIISKYGIPSSNIVQVKNPYEPTEILKKYPSKSTALVVIFGAKDAGRLEGSGKYYLPYEQNKGKLEGYRDHGYYIIAQHESVKVIGKEISGTIIRKLLGSRRLDKKRKAEVFKQIFGWFDKEIFDLVIDRLTRTVKESQIKHGVLLIEGGAYGHMAHPFDDMDLTFGDFKDIVRLALQGHLDKEAKITEKLDGQALSISWKDGHLIAARNRGHLKNQGADALGTSDLKLMFAGRGELEKSFGSAVDDLESAIKSLTEKQKSKIFQEGKNFMAVEVLYPKTQNVIPYGENMLVFHGVMEYDNNGNVVGENKEFARMLAGMIRQVNQHIQKTYKITAPSFLNIPASQDFGKKQKYFISKIDALKNKFKLKDTDTVSMYHQKWWEDFISKKTRSMKYAISNTILMKLVQRWAFFDKSISIIDICNMIDNDKFKLWVKDFDKNKHSEQMRANMLPFETLFLELGTNILKNASGFLAANPDEAVQSIRKSVQSAVKELEGSHDLTKINKLRYELNKINAIGGFSKIVPTEGLVFQYGGKTYKLTGAFAPVNHILGMLKYGD